MGPRKIYSIKYSILYVVSHYPTPMEGMTTENPKDTDFNNGIGVFYIMFERIRTMLDTINFI